MSRAAYLIYAIAVLAFAGVARAKGMLITPPAPNRVAPASVRANPGAYRPVYRGSYGTFRGK